MSEFTYRVPLNRALKWPEMDDNWRRTLELQGLMQSQVNIATTQALNALVARQGAESARDQANIEYLKAKDEANKAERSANRAAVIAGFDGKHNTLVDRDALAAHPASSISYGSGTVKTALDDLTMGGAGSSYKTLTPAATVTVQVGTASLFRLNLNRDLTNIVFSNTAAQAGKYQQFTMILKQGTGSNLVKWPDSVRWSFGNEPALSFSKDYEDVITFVRHAQSTVWYGFFNGGSIHV